MEPIQRELRNIQRSRGGEGRGRKRKEGKKKKGTIIFISGSFYI
jgi:hypothetical protein